MNRRSFQSTTTAMITRPPAAKYGTEALSFPSATQTYMNQRYLTGHIMLRPLSSAWIAHAVAAAASDYDDLNGEALPVISSSQHHNV